MGFGHCKDCKFWGTHEKRIAYFDVNTGLMVLIKDFRTCQGIPTKPDSDYPPIYTAKLAYTWDDQNFDCGLDTHADFGCANFYEKSEVA